MRSVVIFTPLDACARGQRVNVNALHFYLGRILHHKLASAGGVKV